MISYSQIPTPFSKEVVEQLLNLSSVLFPTIDSSDFTWRIERMPELSGFVARDESEIVGFKLGYAVTSERYYSWLGGVHPAYQRRGLATQLMKRQHQWVQAEGFKVIETELIQTNHAMGKLNEASGFTTAGVRFDTKPRLIYRRAL